jgi:hypothetical protein
VSILTYPYKIKGEVTVGGKRFNYFAELEGYICNGMPSPQTCVKVTVVEEEFNHVKGNQLALDELVKVSEFKAKTLLCQTLLAGCPPVELMFRPPEGTA